MENSKTLTRQEAQRTRDVHSQMQNEAMKSNNGRQHRNVLKEYRMILLVAVANLVLWYFSPSKAHMSVNSTGSIFKEMLMILPPMFLFVGMIDQWVPREVIGRHVGSDSGAKGMVIAMLLGSMTIGPVYAGFPLAAMLLKKGARVSNVVAFLTVKGAAELPLVLVESKFMGIRFALVRLSLTFAAAIIMGWIIEKASCRWPAADLPASTAETLHPE